MKKSKRIAFFSTVIAVLIWGGLWGIFEASVGYILHLLPISVGWLVWYSVACFFMGNVYRTTKRVDAVIYIGFISAGIKLINLFAPIRIDKVINPALSIIFEALSFAVIILIYKRLKLKKTAVIKAITVLVMNTTWRSLYILYLVFIAPDWIRNISVISSASEFIKFFLLHNLISSTVIFAGVLLIKHMLKPVKFVESKISNYLSTLQSKKAQGVKISASILLLVFSIVLNFFL